MNWIRPRGERMAESGMCEIVALSLPGKDGPLGIIAVGSTQHLKFQADEISYLGNVANLLGIDAAERAAVRAGRDGAATVGVHVRFDRRSDPRARPGVADSAEQPAVERIYWAARTECARWPRRSPSCCRARTCATRAARTARESPAKATRPIRGCQGIFWRRIPRLPIPRAGNLGTVHVLKDITERKRAEEKYRTLISNVQEGVFISTPAGRFLDFNDALMRMLGYEHRDELLSVDIPVDVRKYCRSRAAEEAAAGTWLGGRL